MSGLDNIVQEIHSQAQKEANRILNATLSQLIAAVNLMELEQLGAIVSNVMFLGLPEMQRAILFEKEKEKHV